MKHLFSFFLIGNLVQLSFAQVTPTLDWEYFTGAPSFGSAAAADLDKDGKLEIVFTTYTNDGQAHCLNAEDGSVLWIYDIGGCGDVAPLIYDLDGDDTLDVLVNGSCNPTVFSINGASGKLNWSVPSGGGDSPPTVADLDGDTKPEIAMGSFDGVIRIFNGEDGSIAKNLDPNAGTIQTAPALADVNGDQNLDIIVSNYWVNDGLYTWAYDFATGDTLWTNYLFDTTSPFNAYHAGAIADVDNDTKLEYVTGSNSGVIRAINIEDGSTEWTRNIPGSLMSALSIADLDNDNVLEISIVNSDPVTFDNRIWVLNGLNGQDEWSYPVDFPSFRGPSIADVDGNGSLDLITTHFQGMLRAVEPYSGLVFEYNMDQHLPSNLPYTSTDHGPLIADFDNDGMMEVFSTAGYGTFTPDSQNTGKAFLIEAGPGFCPEWLMFRQDVQRSGYLSKADIEASCDTGSPTGIISLSKLELQVYPNPADNVIHIVFNQIEHSEVTMQIADVHGRVVYQLADIRYPEIEVSLDGFAAGMYLVRIIGKDDAVGKKFVVR